MIQADDCETTETDSSQSTDMSSSTASTGTFSADRMMSCAVYRKSVRDHYRTIVTLTMRQSPLESRPVSHVT